MTDQPIRFNDGAAYEQFMGAWSQLVGGPFLDWLKPQPGKAWIDVGCGNGAFTEQLVQRCKPTTVVGIDPSEGQLAFARTRPATTAVTYQLGDAMALPVADKSFDLATMALVIFFVPEPAKGVAEMVRAVRPGGVVASYALDFMGGGFPYEPILSGMRLIGMKPMRPPSAEASRMADLNALWTGAGLEQIETLEISVTRTFPNAEAYWSTITKSPTTGPAIAALSPPEFLKLTDHARTHLKTDAAGQVTYTARAHAINGLVPKA